MLESVLKPKQAVRLLSSNHDHLLSQTLPTSAALHLSTPLNVYMPIYPHGSLILNNSTLNNKNQFVSTRSTHHVHPDNDAPSPLLALPAESLAHITSFLDPASLFSLARASSVLYKHVSDDNTWHQAFDRQFLAHGPDSDDSAGSFQALLLRRSEDSWKKEFVYRWNLLR